MTAVCCWLIDMQCEEEDNGHKVVGEANDKFKCFMRVCVCVGVGGGLTWKDSLKTALHCFGSLHLVAILIT
jgi:hypothetical protein